MAIKYSFVGDTRKILRVCRDCDFSLFCRQPECPVCGKDLEISQWTESEKVLPTLDELIKPFRGQNQHAIEKFLREATSTELPHIRLANVHPDPFVEHFMAHRNLVGVCPFCDVIQVSSEKCRFCRRVLRFYLGHEDTLKPQNLDIEQAEIYLEQQLTKLRLHDTTLLFLAQSHFVSESWNKANPEVSQRDLLIQIAKSEPAVDAFFADVKEFLERQDQTEFEDFILRAELRRAKISADFLWSFWKENDQLKSIWGKPEDEKLSSQLKVLYFDNFEQFVKGMKIVAEGWLAEKAFRKKSRLEAEHLARMAIYDQEREKSARPKEVSDWWLNRDTNVVAPKPHFPYVARSWKHRWRKPG